MQSYKAQAEDEVALPKTTLVLYIVYANMFVRSSWPSLWKPYSSIEPSKWKPVR